MITSQEHTIANALAKARSPLTAIRAFCISCMGGHSHSVGTCGSQKCPLWPCRMGKNGYRATHTAATPQRPARGAKNAEKAGDLSEESSIVESGRAQS